jgi:hypothetical protein
VTGPSDLKTIGTHNDLVKSVAYRTQAPSPIEPNGSWTKTQYFYTDGGGVLIHGRSYPTIESVEVYDNYSRVCGGGVSVQHRTGTFSGSVLFKNCVFRDNRAAASGSGVDVLMPGSWAEFKNCLFVGNLSNTKLESQEAQDHGALTVFPGCRVTMSDCTFTKNRNGVDDLGTGSIYRNSIFWRNDRPGGAGRSGRFELAVNPSAAVHGCRISGASDAAPQGTLHGSSRARDALDPAFDLHYQAQNKAYSGIGWTPAGI